MSSIDQPDLFGGASQSTRDVVLAHADQFRSDFLSWLEDNHAVWTRFCAEADLVRSRGRQHYSARTIIEVLRHESALADTSPTFKIDNNQAPDLARLYRLTRAGADGFFETRTMPGTERRA